MLHDLAGLESQHISTGDCDDFAGSYIGALVRMLRPNNKRTEAANLYIFIVFHTVFYGVEGRINNAIVILSLFRQPASIDTLELFVSKLELYGASRPSPNELSWCSELASGLDAGHASRNEFSLNELY